ncbi:MAG: methyl-accepting chemotaxis protein, partial [Phycisphaeraceae bacterium]|nr:methyl-accepting chemotaxis protein [Phycisphaeraceae bacterium]
MTLRKKISGLGLAGIVLTVAAIVGVLLVMQGKVRSRVIEQVNALGASECSKIAKDVYLMLRTQDDLLRVKLEGDLKVARQFIASEGAVSFTTPTRWRTVNQFNQQEREIELPRMALGDRELPAQDEAASGTGSLVDKVCELTGSTCTIFQRANEAGDLVRVSTTMRQSDGRRAVGRYIPAVEPDGKANAVVSAMLAGRNYTGRAFAGESWYITSYAPLIDGAGKVIGAMCVGVEQEKIPAVRQGIMQIVAGKTGYVFVLGGQGEWKGRYIISAGGKRDGENILDAKDANGNPFIQELVDKALATRDGSSDFVHYDWQNPGENIARSKVTATTYFEPWDWVIGVGAYESDFQEAAAQVQSSLQSLLIWLLWVAAGALVLCGLVSVIVAGKIASPVVSLTNLLKELSQGQWDLTRRIHVKTSDEVGQLAQWFNHFMQEIHGLIRKISQTTQSVASASTQIAASSEEISHGMDEQSGQLEQVSAAIHELTGSVVEVSGKCGQTAEQA